MFLNVCLWSIQSTYSVAMAAPDLTLPYCKENDLICKDYERTSALFLKRRQYVLSIMTQASPFPVGGPVPASAAIARKPDPAG